MKDLTWIDLVNALGVFVSLLLSAYAVFIVHFDRSPRIKIDAVWSFHLNPHGVSVDENISTDRSSADKKYSLSYVIKNVGSKPVTLYSITVISKSQQYSGVGKADQIKTVSRGREVFHFPYRLEPGEKIAARVENYLFNERDYMELSDDMLKDGYIVARDGTGKEYKRRIELYMSEKRSLQLMRDIHDI